MAPQLNPQLPTVRIQVRGTDGLPVQDIDADAVVMTGNGLRAKSLDLLPQTNLFFLQMPEGRHGLLINAPGYHEAKRFVSFVKGVNPLVEIVLEPRRKPQFRPFDGLSAGVAAVLAASGADGQQVYDGLSAVRRAVVLNILAKMATTTVSAEDGEPLAQAAKSILEFKTDRVYLVLKKGSRLPRRIQDAIKAGRSHFVAAPTHKGFPSGSFKSKEADKKGSLQMSFDAKDPDRVRVDADIDIYTDWVRHFFGEVVWNHLADVKTDPLDVYWLLLEDNILPEYSM